MEQQLLIADADGCLSGLYQNYIAAQGYSGSVPTEDVESLAALRESSPAVLVLSTEMKRRGTNGGFSVMDEDHDLLTLPIVLFNDEDAPASLPQPSSPTEEWVTLRYGDQIAISLSQEQSNKRHQTTRVVDHLVKPFPLRELLDRIGKTTSRPTKSR